MIHKYIQTYIQTDIQTDIHMGSEHRVVANENIHNLRRSSAKMPMK